MKIARCNNCYTFIHDVNPGNNSFDFTEEQLKNVSVADTSFDSGGFMICPKCETDAFLMDVESIEDLVVMKE